MPETYVVLVEGEVLLDNQHRTFEEQYQNALELAEGLSTLVASDSRIVIICDQRPHIGYLLMRSALSSHLLHPIPIDVGIGDSQGAIGYVITRAMRNMINAHGLDRHATNVFTSVVLEENHPQGVAPLRGIGPWFDEERARQYQQQFGWRFIQEAGYGYRRAIYSLPPQKILEMDEISDFVNKGDVVIAGGAGGVPMFQKENGELVGAEELVEAESTATMIAEHIGAAHLLIVVENEIELIRHKILTDPYAEMSRQELETLLADEKNDTSREHVKLEAALRFLQGDGRQVIITTNSNLARAVVGKSGLSIR